jgi:hypothetical protein
MNTMNNIIYSPSLFVYNTQKTLYFVNTSYFSIFERVLRLVFYILIFFNIYIFNIFFIYLFFYILILFLSLNIYNFKRNK